MVALGTGGGGTSTVRTTPSPSRPFTRWNTFSLWAP